ncbi:MAG: hypothetical protein LUI04_00595 [Porphyromonadaceae bacterium]|nr:hypothetical protein [Porphyromonadaceae bacterium]
MKKRKSLFLIWMLAHLIVWVHATIPHHHHSRLFVAVVHSFGSEFLTLLDHTHEERASEAGYTEGIDYVGQAVETSSLLQIERGGTLILTPNDFLCHAELAEISESEKTLLPLCSFVPKPYIVGPPPLTGVWTTIGRSPPLC